MSNKHFNEEVKSTGLLAEVVRWQRASKRAGTHTVKTRAESRGGGAKPWRQKGTGRARAGSNTSPIWVGGGVAHGPKQRDYSFDVNKKEKKKALKQALSLRDSEGKLIVLKDFGLSEIKTKAAAEMLAQNGINRGDKALVVLADTEEQVSKSIRNLPGVKPIHHHGLNVYDILNAQYVVFSQAALDKTNESL